MGTHCYGPPVLGPLKPGEFTQQMGRVVRGVYARRDDWWDVPGPATGDAPTRSGREAESSRPLGRLLLVQSESHLPGL